MNENSSYAFHLEHRPNWGRMPVGQVELRGWFVPKENRPVHDLRVVVGRRLYPARHGLPRPDLAAQWPQVSAAFYAGFAAEIAIGPGDTDLQLQFLNHDFQWVEFWRRSFRVRPLTLASRPRPRLHPGYLPALMQRHLQERAGRPAFVAPGTMEDLIAAACTPPVDHQVSPPWHAALDIPATVAIARYHLVHVCGWAFHETQRIRSLYGTTGVNDFHPLKSGLPQEGVAQAFPGTPQAQACMFFGIFPLPPARMNPAPIKIYAELEDGSHHLILERRFWAMQLPDSEHPLPDDRLRHFLSAALDLRERIQAAECDAGDWRSYVRGLRQTRAKLADWFSTQRAPFPWQSLSPHLRQRRRQEPSPRLLRRLYEAERNQRGATPRIGVVTVADGHEARQLTPLADALLRQIFPKWEWVIVPADDAARELALPLSRRDARIRVTPVMPLPAALQEVATDYLAVIEADAILEAEALWLVAESAVGPTPPELIYTDEETVTPEGEVTPWAWPEWSPSLALSGALGRGLVCLSRSALETTGAFQIDDDRAWALAALLRVAEKAEAGRIRHLAAYAIRRPATPAPAGRVEATVAAVARALHDRGLDAVPVPIASPAGHCWVQVRWSAGCLARLPVTIVIPTRDRLDLLQRCIQRLERTVDWRHVRLTIVDDGSRDPKAIRYLDTLEERTDLPVRVLRAGSGQPFNYSRLVNLGTGTAQTPLVLHLNNDVDAVEPGWLEQMVGWFACDDTGVVGAKLLYADGRINHAGIAISHEEALPFTLFEGRSESSCEHPALHQLTRDASAVIGACLLTRTSLYRQLGGFEEQAFGVAYNDVDYCLRARAAGARTLYTPSARLVHWGSESRGRSFHESEHLAFLESHGAYRDPCLNPQLKISGRTVGPDLERPAHAHRAPALRLCVASHNLGFEGAPLFLYEFVEHAVRQGGCQVELLAFAEGPLRAAYEELGVRITIVDRHPIHAARTPEEYAARIGVIRRSLDLSRIDLMVANTVIGFWVVELARQAGLPSLWFIHESSRVPRFFAQELQPGMQRVVHEAFRQATRVTFLCEATRRYYDEFNVRDHFRILPGWADVARIRAFRNRSDRAALRRRHGIGEDEIVVVNVGTLCERKGQHTFIPAARRLVELQGRAIRFLMIGGLNDLYHELFAAEPAVAAFPQAQVVTKTESVYDYYALADLAVCTSFEESFPRVLLEAMAFEVPIVTTDVHGSPEIIANRAEGLLVQPGDVEQLARTMSDMLAQSRTPNSLAPMALSKVMRRFDCRRLIPRHLDLAREAALG